MKTAISLPDDLYHAAERHREQRGKSRSQLYAEALSEYLSRHAPDEVTDAMDRVLAKLEQPAPETFVTAAARRLLERSEW
ncbi:MAG: ribbon-helix-helix protein, CopG family [Gemmatimonadetes bacterium]|nr:ribbon-helix-helix protein, CopG family [Gemmatimonadota bacterium]